MRRVIGGISLALAYYLLATTQSDPQDEEQAPETQHTPPRDASANNPAARSVEFIPAARRRRQDPSPAASSASSFGGLPDELTQFTGVHLSPESVEAWLRWSYRVNGASWDGWHAELDCTELPCLVVLDSDYDDMQNRPRLPFPLGYGERRDAGRSVLYPLPLDPGALDPDDLTARIEGWFAED